MQTAEMHPVEDMVVPFNGEPLLFFPPPPPPSPSPIPPLEPLAFLPPADEYEDGLTIIDIDFLEKMAKDNSTDEHSDYDDFDPADDIEWGVHPGFNDDFDCFNTNYGY